MEDNERSRNKELVFYSGKGKVMNLEFHPLDYAHWIMNAVMPVSKHFQLSISYGNGDWYVGEIGSYEVVIQVWDGSDSPYRSLVELPDNKQTNIYIYYNCNYDKIYKLAEIAKGLKYAGEIEVFDSCVFDTEKKPKTWGHKFFCAEGNDLEEKLAYVKQVWDKDWRFIPAKGE